MVLRRDGSRDTIAVAYFLRSLRITWISHTLPGQEFALISVWNSQSDFPDGSRGFGYVFL